MNMKSTKAFFTKIYQRITDRFAPKLGDLYAELDKVEAKIERAIAKIERDIKAVADAKMDITVKLSFLNKEADANYKLLHKVTELTK